MMFGKLKVEKVENVNLQNLQPFNFLTYIMFIILSISDSDKHREKVVEEYTKRLGRSVKIENITPSRKGNTEQMIQADTENIIARLQKF